MFCNNRITLYLSSVFYLQDKGDKEDKYEKQKEDIGCNIDS